MKYDSSMTQFHADIVKVMRTMCGSDNEITKKFNPDDNSPAPLRDYIKAKHGSSVHGWGNANLYCDCRPKELKITVSQETIEFSWSQVTKFIRDNWEEIFKKTEDTQPSEKQPKEEQPTYINKLREKYPKINETDEWFDEIYCPSELLNGEGVSYIDDEKSAYGDDDPKPFPKRRKKNPRRTIPRKIKSFTKMRVKFPRRSIMPCFLQKWAITSEARNSSSKTNI